MKSKGIRKLGGSGRLVGSVLLLILLTVGFLLYAGKGKLAKADEAQSIATIDTQTFISGRGEPGEIIHISVYVFRDGYGVENERVILFSTDLEVGNSGVYQLSVPLPLIGEQFLELEMGGEVRTTRYIRYSKNIGTTLSETYLNVFEYLLEGTP